MKSHARKEYEKKLHLHFDKWLQNLDPEQRVDAITRIREVAADLADGNVQWYDAVKFVEQAKGVKEAV